jgi:hypothetical protein
MKNRERRHTVNIEVYERFSAATQKWNFERLLLSMVSKLIDAFGFESWGRE